MAEERNIQLFEGQRVCYVWDEEQEKYTSSLFGLWESLHNPHFNRVQFDTFRTESGLR